ncbi:hypothetical protein JW935_22045 [candidate division KSB1 bacterium]|nr:hypothetical protein [candidate division KSB1 bacterium]
MKKLLLVGLLFMLGCNSQKVTDPLSLTRFNIEQSNSLFGHDGQQRDTFYSYETIYLSIKNLYGNWETDIEIAKESNCDQEFELLVASDIDGEIHNLPVWHFTNTDENGAPIDQSGNYIVHIVQAHHQKPWKNYKIPFTIINSLPPFAQARLTDAAGIFKHGSYLLNEDVYIEASGLPANTEVRIYIQNCPGDYSIGAAYTDVSGKIDTVTTTGGGAINTTLVWPSAGTTGCFDVVVDLAPFGEYNNGDLVLNPLEPGLMIQTPSQTTDIITDIACNGAGIHLDIFDEKEEIFACICPTPLPRLIDGHLHDVQSGIFLMPHKEIWVQDEPLLFIETGGSMQSPTICLTNPVSQSLALIRIRTESKPNYRRPVRLWPGDYDVILDVNNNTLYDPGIDVLDGGTRAGFSIPGEKPEIYFFMTAFTDYAALGPDDTLIRALVFRSDGTPVTGVTVDFRVVKGPGAVHPTSDVTGPTGVAETRFSEGKIGEWSLVRALVTVGDVQYKCYTSVHNEIPCTHYQGDLYNE